ncbi:hypothetical protein DPMN_192617 [Dreissena polymorpha]|uniref:Uncharacterized protein n=1 Tax=Dreissena polymorpha TaxID=45954 RepID=A0A9D4BFA1_DREPO|nr:hypothetical protein DPMN_192617 [Dreissena polymorpha]
MIKCLYPAFCVHMKRPGLAAVEKGGDYEGLVEPVLGWEADGTACHILLSLAIAAVAIAILIRT